MMSEQTSEVIMSDEDSQVPEKPTPTPEFYGTPEHEGLLKMLQLRDDIMRDMLEGQENSVVMPSLDELNARLQQLDDKE
jgi:hypothetical protein